MAATKKTGEIYKDVVEDGREELKRASMGLAFSALSTGLVHCVAGSTEVLISIFMGETYWGEYLGGFLLPATLGNTIGGIVLVTLANYAQVAGSEAKL
jgi:formate/nitrite transporter FocA (FNT family)